MSSSYSAVLYVSLKLKVINKSINNSRDELLTKILEICNQNDYQYISNFEWYVLVEKNVLYMRIFKSGALLNFQNKQFRYF